ncbi:TPA: phage tail protein [Streptococcus suis]|nr:phage tail protein [Streptococcus suis]
MIYLFDKDEKLIKIVRKSAVKTALQKYALTTERYVSDRLTVELKGLNADELEQVEYMAIQTMEDAHTFHYFYVAQKFSESLTTLIGVQSGIEELRKSPVFDKRPKNALARDVITDLLAGTNWQARFVGETTPHSTNFYYTSIFDALKKVCEVWDLEMQFFVEMNGNRIGARYIDFKQRIGEAVGKRVVYGHNALQILQEVERTNIFTALVGRGKGEETDDGYGRKITFENVVWSRTQGKPVDKPKGQKYLELPLMTRQYGIKNADGSMRPKIGFVDFSEEENPEVLIERTYRALVDAARPQLTLKTSSVYLRGVKVGDTIRVVRHDKKLDYDTRIFEITFNRLNNQSSDIKLGDRIGQSNEAKVQTIADKAVEQFVNNEFSNFVQNLPDYLPSADGFNNNWYGTEDPTVKYPGKVLINDIWYKPDPEHEGHKIMLRWTGEVWEEILRTYDSEALRDRIAEDIAQVNQSMQAQSEEHDRQVADILSKTQSIESLANQAKTDAASALARANQVKTEAIADARLQVATVNQALNSAKSELQTAIASADQKARDSQASATALRNDLNLQASKILEQARAQTALTNRVTTVETLADGTRSTVAELSRTMQEATQNIASVTSRTRTVEDTLSQTRSQYEALTQTVNTQTGQIESINRKTADLQSGIDGVTERFESLQIGGTNYFRGYKHNEEIALPIYQNVGSFIQIYNKLTYPLPEADGKTFTISFEAISPNGDTVLHVYNANGKPQYFYFSASNIGTATNAWKKFKATVKPITQATFTSSTNSNKLEIYAPSKTGVKVRNIKVELGTVATDWSPDEEDLRSEIATYKRTVEESSAELSRQIQLADGKAVEAKTYAQQTATAIDTRLESLETYKDAEGTRASQYLTASRTETAKQLSAERAAIATNYVAKSNYDENVRGTTLKLNEIKTTADTAKQNLATYQNTVDRKLEELTSSAQTLDGKINTASAKVDTVAGQIRTEISEVEGKIPTEIGGRNYFRGYKYNEEITLNNYQGVGSFTQFYNRLTYNLPDAGGKEFTISFEAISPNGDTPINVYNDNGAPQYFRFPGQILGTAGATWQKFTRTVTVATQTVSNTTNSNRIEIYAPNKTGVRVRNIKVELGNIATDWSPAPEDYDDELSSVKTTITQTASGVEQLSTSLTTTDSKVTTAETKIRQLISDVSSKVSQTDYNTLTGRVDSAETAITQNATEISKRLTSTQVNQAILADKQIKDTRNDNQSPQWYWTNHPKQTVEEFKYSAVIGLSGESAYAILTTNVQWENSSGGKVKQTAKTDRATYERYGAGTTWEAWTKIANAGDLANYTTKTEFQTVKETTSLYERIIGSTETGIKDKVARMVMADSLFLTEVKDKISGTATQVSQLAGSYAIKNLTKAGDVLGQINLNKDGSVRINEGLISIGERTYIKDGVITSAKIAGLDAGKITTGTLDAARIKANSIDGSKLVFDQAFVNKMTANEALFKQLFAQSAFITSVQAVAISATQIVGGIIKSTNNSIVWDLNAADLVFNTNAKIRFNDVSNTISYTKNGTTGLLKFNNADYNAPEATFGVNRNGDFSSSNGMFSGIRVRGFKNTNGSFIDEVYAIGDDIYLTGGYGENNGFRFSTAGDELGFYPRANRQYALGSPNLRFTTLYLDEVNIRASSTKSYNLREALGKLAAACGVSL